MLQHGEGLRHAYLFGLHTDAAQIRIEHLKRISFFIWRLPLISWRLMSITQHRSTIKTDLGGLAICFAMQRSDINHYS
jgi:hypothetical protein